jgi:hypothetical protein
MIHLNLESAVDTLRFLREAGGPHSRQAATHLRRFLLVAAERADASDREAIRNAVLYHNYGDADEVAL